jgi:hypothetical protein
MKGLALTCILGSLLAAVACSLCDEEKISDTASPDGRLVASVLWYGCGAMAKDATWVTLHRAGDKANRSEEQIYVAIQEHAIEIRWLDDSHLSIHCRGCSDADVRFQVVKRGSVTISFN